MAESNRRKRVTTLDLAIAEFGAPIEVRRHPRARRFTLRVNEARREAVFTIPLYVSAKEAVAFLSRHKQWLTGRLQALPVPAPFADGMRLPLRGHSHVVRFVGTARGRGVAWIEDGLGFDLPLFGGAPVICVTGGTEHAPRRLADWLRSEARADLARRVARHAEVHRVKVKRITVRDQATRWGSCSSTGVVSFSWRLVLTPPFVLDYVAAHEVAHLRELNHGPRFWRLVAKTVPRMDEAREWLKAHGVDLHRYGAGE